MGQSYLNRQLGSVRSPINGAILIAGTVATDGSGNVTSVTPTSGYEFSCSRTGTGVYTLTLSDKAKTFLGGWAGDRGHDHVRQGFRARCFRRGHHRLHVLQRVGRNHGRVQPDLDHAAFCVARVRRGQTHVLTNLEIGSDGDHQSI